MSRVAVPSYVYVLVVVEHEGRFLLIHETKHGQGWYLPAGGVEPGETLIEAARRETLEEGGVRVEPTGLLRVEQTWPTSAEGTGRFRFVFTARLIGTAEPKRRADDHSLEARWVSADEIPAYALRHPEVIEHVGRVRSGAPVLPLDGYALACFPMLTRAGGVNATVFTLRNGEVLRMRVVVTGGAGYIGSHMVHVLRERGHEVAVVDSLVTGRREAVPAGVPLLVADVGDRAAVVPFLRERRAEAVLHFAALIQVGESVVDPRRYYAGNLVASAGLLDAVLEAGVGRVVFSSTAAVYGVPSVDGPIPESHPTVPVNPYGETKLAVERMLASYARAYNLRYAALRYFNAAGALASAGLGERHEPESHLIPLVLRAALGEGPPVTVFGRDYPTPDGTCVRDYIHVLDLAEAHLAALEHLGAGVESGAFNLGTGRGYSVAEVLAEAARVSGREVPAREGPRRPGDPPSLVADPSLALARLGWQPRRSSLAQILEDAWQFHAAPHAPQAAPT